MTAVEFGTQNQDTVMLLHGGGLSWWNYREAAAILAESYHVILPVLDGHGDSDTPFVSIEETGARLIDDIDDRFGGQVLALAGLSLGGQVAAQMLSMRPDICRKALLESTSVEPSPLTRALIKPTFGMSYGLIRQKWFARAQADYLGIPRSLFDKYYEDTCKISRKDLIAILEASSAYAVDPRLSETAAAVKIVAGSREQRSILRSAQCLAEAIPNSSVEILPGLGHGDLSINHPRQYARLLTEWIRS